MDTFTMPTDLDLARERIEMAWRDYRFCRDCGQPMVIETHDAALWIECASLRSRRGLRLLLAAGLHERHAIDLPAEVAIPAVA